MPHSLHMLHPTPQIKGLHTFIRCRNTSRDEFIFYSKRLIRLVIEYDAHAAGQREIPPKSLSDRAKNEQHHVFVQQVGPQQQQQ